MLYYEAGFGRPIFFVRYAPKSFIGRAATWFQRELRSLVSGNPFGLPVSTQPSAAGLIVTAYSIIVVEASFFVFLFFLFPCTNSLLTRCKQRAVRYSPRSTLLTFLFRLARTPYSLVVCLERDLCLSYTLHTLTFSMRTNSVLTPCKQGAVLSCYSLGRGNEVPDETVGRSRPKPAS